MSPRRPVVSHAHRAPSSRAYARAAASLLLLLLTVLIVLVTGLTTAPSATAASDLSIAGCATGAAATTFGTLVGSTSATTSQNCTVLFGSDNSTASLKVSQSDDYGTAMTDDPSGPLDPGFATSGVQQWNINAAGDNVVSVVKQPDGKILAIGHTLPNTSSLWDITRLNEDGSLDTSFGSGGHVITAAGGGTSSGDFDDDYAGALQPDGKIVVTGTAYVNGAETLTAIRLLPDGSLDPSFGNGGIFTANPAAAYGFAIAIQPDGKIVIGGATSMTNCFQGNCADMVVLRLNGNGTIDNGFAAHGYLYNWSDGEATAVAVQPDGKVLVSTNDPSSDLLLMRLNPDGSPDTTFGTAGVANAGWNEDHVYLIPILDALAVQPDGKIVVAGNNEVGSSGNYEFAVHRFTSTGATDTSFGSSGNVFTQQSATFDQADSLVVAPDGALVVGGVSVDGSTNYCAAILRLTPSGAFDTTFNGTGIEVQSGSLCNPYDQPSVTIIGANGVYVTGTSLYNGSNASAAVLQFSDHTIPNYSSSTDNWSGSASLFGICLNSVSGTGATANWTASGSNCPATDAGGSWNAVPASEDTTSKAAISTTSGTTNATASFRFGMRAAAGQQPGSYYAPVTFDVIAPNLTPPSNTALPTIGGTPSTRSTLTATNGTWSGSTPMTFAYQWQHCSGTCSNIAGATASSYSPGTSDVGDTLQVVVTATNSEGSASATSAQTAAVTSHAVTGVNMVEGLEVGPLLTFGLSPGSPTVESNVVHNGSYALEDNASTTSAAYMGITQNVVTVSRLYVDVDNMPTSAVDLMTMLDSSGSSDRCNVSISATGKWMAHLGTTASPSLATQTSATALTTNSWHSVDMSCDFTNHAWALQWQIDGVPQPTVTYATGTGDLGANLILVGVQTVASQPGVNVYDDDIVVSSSSGDYPIGAGHVDPIVPTSAPAVQPCGCNTKFKYDASTAVTDPVQTSYVSELPFGTTTTGPDGYIQQKTSGSTSYLELDDPTTTETTTANGLEAEVALQSSSSTGGGTTQIKVLRSGDTDATAPMPYNGDTSMGAAEVLLTSMIPAPAAGWTPAQVSALEYHIGYWNGSGGIPWFDDLMIQADFPTGSTPQSTSPPTITGSARVGQILTASTGTWSPTPTSYSYQWERCDATGANCSPIAGATASTYTLVLADAGSTVSVLVVATNAAGNQMQMSAPTATVTSPAADIVFATGFESGSLSTNGGGIATSLGGSGLESITTAHVHNGAYALHIAEDGTHAGDLQRNPTTAAGISVSRVAFMLESLPTATKSIYSATATAGGAAAVVSVSPAGVLTLQAAAGSGTQTGPTIVPYHWYTLDVRATVNATTWTANWQVDGTTYPTSSVGTSQPNTTVKGWILGSTTTANAMTADYDDWAISSATADYPLGFAKDLAYYPVGEGAITNPTHYKYCTSNATTGGNCTAFSAALANASPGDSDYFSHWPVAQTPPATEELIEQPTAPTTDSMGIDLSPSTEASNPDAVSVLGAHRTNAAGTSNAIVGLTDAAGSSAVYSKSPIDGFAAEDYLYGVLDTAPTGVAWTTALLDSSHLTLTDSTNSPWVVTDAIMTEVDYPEGASPTNVTAPAVGFTGGTAPVTGTVMTTTNGTWSGPTIANYAYQWQDCDASGNNCTDITGANSASYTVAATDAGDTFRMIVTAFNSSGGQVALSTTSTQTAPGIAPTAGTASVSGTTTVGQVLTAGSSGWGMGTPVGTMTYQWERCDSSGNSCVSIGGATASTYTLVAADATHTIRVVITVTNTCTTGCGAANATSAQTAVVIQAQPSFVAKNNTSMVNGISAVVTKPAGITAGDTLLAQIVTQTAPSSTPAGFTLIGTNSLAGEILSSYYKIATGAEPASYSWSWGSSTNAIAEVSDFTNTNPTSPIMMWNGTTGNSFSLSAPSLVLTGPALVVPTYGCLDNTMTTPAGTTQRFFAFNSTFGADMQQDTESFASAGATGAFAATDTGAFGTCKWSAQTIALTN